MILVFDVGNTETTIGLFAGTALRGHWRVTSGTRRTSDEYGMLVRELLAASSFQWHEVTGVAIGSVVPGVTGPLRDGCERWVAPQRPVIVVDGRSPLPISVEVDEPLTVGADRLINTLAASRLYERDAIVVDLGTATTFDCITREGVFLGGVIAPGVLTQLESLVRGTSKLPATELIVPANVIGKRTEECIRSGVIFGSAEAIDGLVRRIRDSWPRPETPIVVATGGLAETFKPLCQELDIVAPYLTLHGLQMAFEHLSLGAA